MTSCLGLHKLVRVRLAVISLIAFTDCLQWLWRKMFHVKISDNTSFFLCSCFYLFTFLLSSQFYWHIRLKSTAYFLTHRVYRLISLSYKVAQNKWINTANRNQTNAIKKVQPNKLNGSVYCAGPKINMMKHKRTTWKMKQNVNCYDRKIFYKNAILSTTIRVRNKNILWPIRESKGRQNAVTQVICLLLIWLFFNYFFTTVLNSEGMKKLRYAIQKSTKIKME